MISLVLLFGLGLMVLGFFRASKLMRPGGLDPARTPLDGPIRLGQILTGRGVPAALEAERRQIALLLGAGLALTVGSLVLIAVLGTILR